MAVGSRHQEWIELGTAIVINQHRDMRYRGQAGVVVGRLPRDCVLVKLPEQLGYIALEVFEKDLSVPRKGTHVELHGIETVPSLNGQVGTIDDGVLDNACKMKVRLADDSVKNVKVTKIIPRSRLWEIDLFCEAPACIEWRKEQENIFISEDGQHHYYIMHLPFGFVKRLSEGGTVRSEPWPLLMFMHGTGGERLVSYTKKALRSIGIQYVAARFVIVSPKCTWTWKQPVETWVAELAQNLRACSWVDPDRVYLTGCSMGGMGTWEVAALVPDVCAAIAPVATHHKAHNNAQLVEKLREMPILAVHATDDTTCFLQPEEELWQALRAGGNTRLQVCCAPRINHSEAFDRAYCDSPMIFEWLLKHRRPLPSPAMATVDDAAAIDTLTIEC